MRYQRALDKLESGFTESDLRKAWRPWTRPQVLAVAAIAPRDGWYVLWHLDRAFWVLESDDEVMCFPSLAEAFDGVEAFGDEWSVCAGVVHVVASEVRGVYDALATSESDARRAWDAWTGDFEIRHGRQARGVR